MIARLLVRLSHCRSHLSAAWWRLHWWLRDRSQHLEHRLERWYPLYPALELLFSLLLWAAIGLFLWGLVHLFHLEPWIRQKFREPHSPSRWEIDAN